MTHLGTGDVAALGRTLDGRADPIGLFEALCGDRRDTLLLESAEPEATDKSRSLIVSRSALRIATRDRLARIEALTPGGRNLLSAIAARLEPSCELTREGDILDAGFPDRAEGDERSRLLAPSVLDAVRATLASLRLVAGDGSHPPLVAGSFSYDLLGTHETLPETKRDPRGWPDVELWLAEELVWLEPTSHAIRTLRYAYGGDEPTYHDAAAALGSLVERCRGVAAPAIPASASDAIPEVDLDDEAFANLVAELKDHIFAGDVFQIVPSRRFSRPCPRPLEAYARLRRLEPSPYMFFVRGRRGTLFGASPESAVAVDGSRHVTISPIAGTRRRGLRDGILDADLDSRIEAELRLDEKELAEHMMLVDLARNDVAQVSKPGSRRVTSLLDVVRYSRVMHLVSEVQGDLRDELDGLHTYLATMNMGTLTGAPKLEAARLLRIHEPERRGPYGGAVGYLDASGVLDTCIVIRSCLVQDGIGSVRAGAGVVADSDPRAEADETRRKAAAVLSILGEGV